MQASPERWLLVLLAAPVIPVDLPSHILEKGRALDVQPDPDVEGIWWVSSPSGRSSRRRVQRLEGMSHSDGTPLLTCSCPYGARHGISGHCKHRAAVLLFLEEA